VQKDHKCGSLGIAIISSELFGTEFPASEQRSKTDCVFLLLLQRFLAPLAEGNKKTKTKTAKQKFPKKIQVANFFSD
jgi:hypothetical protein